MKSPLINILIRTSNRPNYFKKCINSVRNQTYKNFNMIVSVDNDYTDLYVEDEGFIPIIVDLKPKVEINICPWNLHLNKLIEQVKSGWILMLDDDDHLRHKNVLKNIAKNIECFDQNTLHVWQMTWPNGRIIPENEYMGKLPFVRKHIGMPCFTFHSKFKNRIKFDAMRAADFRVVTLLAGLVSHINWINNVFINIGNTGLVGAAKDLKI